jgi:hypothetical protein
MRTVNPGSAVQQSWEAEKFKQYFFLHCECETYETCLESLTSSLLLC